MPMKPSSMPSFSKNARWWLCMPACCVRICRR